MPDQHDQSFSESWLSLREPVDHAARSRTLLGKLTDWCSHHDAMCVTELGAGTGSNLRYLMPHLGHDQTWLLVDNDSSLLEYLPSSLQRWADTHGAQVTLKHEHLSIRHTDFSATVTTRIIDLANELDQLAMQKTNLLTASALLDLTSADWLSSLAALSCKHKLASLFALNYNGRIQWQPALQTDTTISELLNKHQLSDKGFGAALGPQAGTYFASRLERQGRQVFIDSSDWLIDESMTALQQAIIDGWARAAMEMDGIAEELVNTWYSQRTASIQQGESQLTVGHWDVLALPQ